jgi:hypothetical protein
MRVNLIKQQAEQRPVDPAPLSLKAMEDKLRQEVDQWREKKNETYLESRETLARL